MTRRLSRGALGIVTLIAAGCLGKTTDSTAPLDIQSPGKWIELAPMPTARQEVAVAELNGRVFVIGGFGADSEVVATVEVYDPASNGWQTRTPLPAPTHHAAAAVVDGRLFVVGGYGGGRVSGTPLRTVYEYDEARSSWATRAPLRQARGALESVVLPRQPATISTARGIAPRATQRVMSEPARAGRPRRARALPAGARRPPCCRAPRRRPRSGSSSRRTT